MNKKYFLAVMAIRNYANKIKERVKSVEMLDETGLVYRVNYHSGNFQEYRLGMDSLEIVYITELNSRI
jgi:UDP-N-acetylenolpyruvoylglucosamine reductase